MPGARATGGTRYRGGNWPDAPRTHACLPGEARTVAFLSLPVAAPRTPAPRLRCRKMDFAERLGKSSVPGCRCSVDRPFEIGFGSLGLTLRAANRPGRRSRLRLDIAIPLTSGSSMRPLKVITLLLVV